MDAGERPRRPMHRAGVARAAALTLVQVFSASSVAPGAHTRLASCRVNVPPAVVQSERLSSEKTYPFRTRRTVFTLPITETQNQFSQFSQFS
eukprot:3156999-Prymnesium_polylepis.1